ncbi:MAG TPA: DUF4139 domain-containing protein [Phycisphaerae bacterium]|nr:DUF4139 domain-containing protein [Phycisphaerae bacterium]
MRMPNRLALAAVAAALLAAAPARAAAPPKEGVSLTVYNQNFAVVKEVRKIALAGEVSTVKFRDVAKQIDPTSVHFKSLTDPQGTTVLEQNYEFDLVSADKLLDKYIDKPLVVVTTQGQRYDGTLLSFDPKQLIIQGRGGLYMVQRPDNVQNIEFSALPEGLLTRPTLVWQVATGRPGDHLTQVTYQTAGLSWKADYSALISADDTRMDLSGWVTLRNECGAGFKDAKLKLMAGDVRRVQPPVQVEKLALAANRARGGAAGAGFVEKTFFEYHLYTLGRPTTVNENQVKQVELLTAADVPVTKRYVFEPGGRYWHRRYGQGNTYKVNVFIEFKNAKESKLGMPLPKGKIRTYKRDAADGDLEFVGEDEIDHTPKDEELKLYVGDAFDLVGEKTVTDRKQEQRWRQETIRIDLRNHKDEAATILVREHLTGGGQWTVTAKSQDFKKIDATTIEFTVPVPANGKAQVTYTVDYRW